MNLHWLCISVSETKYIFQTMAFYVLRQIMKELAGSWEKGKTFNVTILNVLLQIV